MIWLNADAYDMKTKKFLKPEDHEFKQQVASSFLVCIADIFTHKLEQALKHYPQIKAITFVGGVACNKFIKRKFKHLLSFKTATIF